MTEHRRTDYILLNKDIPMLEFHCQRNAFGEPEFFEDCWHTPLRPIGYKNLTIFLEQRKAPKHRKHIQQLLEQYGCDDPEGFLRVTHALSLNDTFWVCEANSSLTWRDVSLYSNPFSEIISEAAFDGIISETDLSSTSPEFGTDGYYAKCWRREDNSIYLYKSGSAHYEIEPLSEYLATQLSKQLCPKAVLYEMDYYHGKLVSKCPLFTNENIGLAKASAVFCGEERTIPELLSFFDHVGSGNAFRRMCILDAVILNTDRHYGNFGVLFDTDTLEVLKMAPVFDHNRSLLPELDNDQLADPAWYLRRCKPKLGQDFLWNAKGLLTDDIRQELIKLKDFAFQQHPYIHVEQARLDALNKIVQNQIHLILSD
ncbi:HipA protein [bacterium 1XD42-1]|nr:HipA protein [bacterium 1XD42-8]RKJ63587.1 HipA protein [bacterium 1XD42-1]